MKINNTEFAEILKSVAGFIPRKTTMPVLQGVAVKDGMLYATDMETGVAIKVETEDMWLPEASFSFFNSLPDGETDITVDGDTVKVKNGKIKKIFTIISEGLKAYPYQNIEDKPDSAVIGIETLRALVTSVAYAFDPNNSSKMLTAIHLVGDGERLKSEALDGRRIAIASVESPLKIDVCVSAEAFLKIVKLPFEADVNIQTSKSSITVSDSSIYATARLLEGEFFNLGRILSGLDYKNVVSAGRNQLMDMIKRVLLDKTAESKSPLIVDINVDNAVFSYGTGTTKYTEDMDIVAEQSGDAVKFGINPVYFRDMLNTFDSEELFIKITNPKSPIVFSPKEEEKVRKLAVILPVSFR